MRLNLASGAHPLDGFENLTPPDWHFQDGLGQYADGSVEGVSESHGLMFLPLADWPALFSEIARVLEPGGVVRITEDATDDPASERYGGFDGAVTLTSASLIAEHLEAARLRWTHAEKFTWFRDRSLMQSWHGGSPKCVFIEGIKYVGPH
jgi:SAM-dependent methyltransferase